MPIDTPTNVVTFKTTVERLPLIQETLQRLNVDLSNLDSNIDGDAVELTITSDTEHESRRLYVELTKIGLRPEHSKLTHMPKTLRLPEGVEVDTSGAVVLDAEEALRFERSWWRSPDEL